jgi:hypothetical protein
MLLYTYPAVVVATDNSLIAANIRLNTVVTTTLRWAAAVWCAGRALIDLSDRVAVASARATWEPWEPSGVKRVLRCSYRTGHTASQQGQKEA